MSIVASVIEHWLGRQPSSNELTLLEEMMALVVDHGPDSPSATATRAAASNGQDLLDSVKQGIATINTSHGGAIEGLVRLLESSEFDAATIVISHLDTGTRLPGFGHRLYKDQDPRAEKLLARMLELGWDDTFLVRARQLEAELLTQKGNKLVLNIDGAMAVVLTTLGIEAAMANGFFLWPRVAGLIYRFRVAKVIP